MRIKGILTKAFDAAVASGLSKVIDVSDFKHVIVTIVGAGTAGGTIKFWGSISEITSASTTASATNPVSTIESKNLADSTTTYAGATGIVFAADGCITVELNTNGLEKMFIDLTRTGGNFTAYVRGYSD